MSPQELLSSRTVLVTGGAGFIGSRLSRTLLEGGARVIVADDLSTGVAGRLASHPRLRFQPLDVAAPGALRGLLGEEGEVDTIVHLAARVGVRRVLADPEGCWRSHLAMGRELLAAIDSRPAAGRPRLLAASTSEVYADRRGSLDEDAPLRSLGAAGRWAYAASKLAVERLLDGARSLWAPGRGPLHLRFFNVVGPGQGRESGMVLPRFVHQALTGEELTVYGSGRATRTFAHVDEVAKDLAALVARESLPEGPLNLGGSAHATILELAHTVLAATGSSSALRHVDPTRLVAPLFVDVPHRRPDLSRARGLGLVRNPRSLEAIVADVVRAAGGVSGRGGELSAPRENPR